MNESRESSFRPRMWNNGGNPITSNVLKEAIKNADTQVEVDDGVIDVGISEEEVSPEAIPEGAVVLTEEEEQEIFGEVDARCK